jgi:cinnamyl-alcohol dehydrogenase
MYITKHGSLLTHVIIGSAGLKTITGSSIGGMEEVQEMLDFCAEKGVTPMIETIPINYANEALKRLQNNDVHYRFVVDIENSLKESMK